MPKRELASMCTATRTSLARPSASSSTCQTLPPSRHRWLPPATRTSAALGGEGNQGAHESRGLAFPTCPRSTSRRAASIPAQSNAWTAVAPAAPAASRLAAADNRRRQNLDYRGVGACDAASQQRSSAHRPREGASSGASCRRPSPPTRRPGTRGVHTSPPCGGDRAQPARYGRARSLLLVTKDTLP